MVTKRTFLQLGASATAVAASPLLRDSVTSPLGPNVPGIASLKPARFIFDQRFAACRAFGAEAATEGAATYAVNGRVEDLWTLWYGELFPSAGPSKPPVLAGMTEHSTLFALELMAQDERMRPIFRAHHRLIDQGNAHDFFGPHGLLANMGSFDADPRVWPRQSAQLLLHWPVEHNSSSKSSSTVSLARSTPFGTGTLISWLIAPTAAAAATG
jgi:hypothetical protein